MRKVLFASTALVAFGAVGSAQAADPITLKVGGFMQQWIGWASQSNDTTIAGVAGQTGKRNEFVNRDNSEIFFTGSTKLDNGLTVAVRVELEAGAGANSSAIDEANLTLSGGFGRLILGAEDNVSALMQNIAPDVGYGTGFVENFWAVQPTAVTSMTITPYQSTYADDSDVQKVTYITPSFFGFQAGYSYVPNSNDSNYSNFTDAAGTDAHVGAISFNDKFGDVGVKADFGVYSANGGSTLAVGGGTSTGAVKGWRAGTNVSFLGFTVGGHYWRQSQDSFGGAQATTPVSRAGNHWAVGIAYETGPWGVSAAYFKERTEGLLATAGKDTTKQWSLSGKYILGPGIDVALTYQNWDFDDETTTSANNNSTDMVVAGVRVAF
jgi:predicted porin